MLKLDRPWLDSLGLSRLSEGDANDLLRVARNELEGRVDRLLRSTLTEEQLDEFESVIAEYGADDESVAWLNSNFPAYREAVAVECDQLCAEIREAAPRILAVLCTVDSDSQP